MYVKKIPSNLDGQKRIPEYYTMKTLDSFFYFILYTISMNCFGYLRRRKKKRNNKRIALLR